MKQEELIDLLSRHHEVNMRQDPENYNDCDLARDTEQALVACGHEPQLPQHLDFAKEIIKHMYKLGYDGFEADEQFDTAEQMIEHIDSVDDHVTVLFTKFGEKNQTMLVAKDVDPDETAAYFTAEGPINEKWEALNAANH